MCQSLEKLFLFSREKKEKLNVYRPKKSEGWKTNVRCYKTRKREAHKFLKRSDMLHEMRYELSLKDR